MTLHHNREKRNSLLGKFCFSFLIFQLICQCILTTSAIAPPVAEEPVVVVEEIPEEVEELIPMQDPLTPEGNLTLVDDIFTNNEGDKQFITAVSKSGNWFYLVIDRAGDNNNVYLLNMVDEADLMALLLDEDVTLDFLLEEEEPEPEPEPEPEVVEEVVEEVQTEQESNLTPLIGLGLLGGGAAFYFLKLKPSQVPRGNPMFDDMDEDEDEEEEQDD